MKVSEFKSDQLQSQILTNEGIINTIQLSITFSFNSNCHLLMNSLNNDVKLVNCPNNLTFFHVYNENLKKSEACCFGAGFVSNTIFIASVFVFCRKSPATLTIFLCDWGESKWFSWLESFLGKSLWGFIFEIWCLWSAHTELRPRIQRRFVVLASYYHSSPCFYLELATKPTKEAATRLLKAHHTMHLCSVTVS